MDSQNMFAVMEWPTDGFKLSIHHLKHISEPSKPWNSYKPGEEGLSRYPGSRDMWPFKILAVGASRKLLQATLEGIISLRQKHDSDSASEAIKENMHVPVPEEKKPRRKKRVLKETRNVDTEEVDPSVKKQAMKSAINALLLGRGTLLTDAKCTSTDANALSTDVSSDTNALPTDVPSDTNSLLTDVSSDTNALPTDVPSGTNSLLTDMPSDTNSLLTDVLSDTNALPTDMPPNTTSIPIEVPSHAKSIQSAVTSHAYSVSTSTCVNSLSTAHGNSFLTDMLSYTNYLSTDMTSHGNSIFTAVPSDGNSFSTAVPPHDNSFLTDVQSHANSFSTDTSSATCLSTAVPSAGSHANSLLTAVPSQFNSIPTALPSSNSNLISISSYTNSVPNAVHSNSISVVNTTPSRSYYVSSLLSSQSKSVPICPTPVSALPRSYNQSAFTMLPHNSPYCGPDTSRVMQDAHSVLYTEKIPTYKTPIYEASHVEGSDKCHSCCFEINKIKAELAELKEQQQIIFREMAMRRCQVTEKDHQSSNTAEEIVMINGKTKVNIEQIASNCGSLTDAVKCTLGACFTTSELLASSVRGQQKKGANSRPGLDESRRNYIENLLSKIYKVTVKEIRAKIRDRLKLVRRQYGGLDNPELD